MIGKTGAGIAPEYMGGEEKHSWIGVECPLCSVPVMVIPVDDQY